MTIHLYRTGNVLALLGISRSTLNLWVSQGKFPKPRKLGQRLNVWSSTDIDSWLGSANSHFKSGGGV